MARAFFTGHNYQINLAENQDGTERYRDMFTFLRQSRIHHVLTHAPTIYEPYLIEFWTNARHVTRAGGEVITSKVANQVIEFSADDLRRILQLGTVEQEGGTDGPTVFDRSVIIGGLKRMGFAGDVSKSTLFKKGFFGRWRYLAHVLLVGLSNKKTGWDTLSQEAQAQMVGIVYNKPYSFSKYFFNEMRKQISARGTTRFLMYPRFVMMILNDRLPGLPAVQPVVKVTTLVKRSYNEFITRNVNDPNAQDVELFGAIIDRNFVTPSDEEIAGSEEISGRQQRQPLSQDEIVAQQVNIMLDEQAANPEVAQAVIHEILQEHAPVNDPVADIDAYLPEVQVEVDAEYAGVCETAERGKKAVEEEDSEMIEKIDSSSDESDDDDDNNNKDRGRFVTIGSKLVSVASESQSRKRKEPEDKDFTPDEDDEEVETTVIFKRPRSRVVESTAPESTSGGSTPLIATPFQFQLNDVNNKLKVVEGMVRALTEEMEKQRKKHEAELEKQRVEHLREMNLMKMRMDRLSADLERERMKNARSLETMASDMARETTSFVSKSELEAALENLLIKKGVISDLGCKGDEMMKKKDDDEGDDPEKSDDEARPSSEDLSKAIVVFKGESTQSSSERRDKGKAPVEEEIPIIEEISSDDDVQEVLFVKPLDIILTTEVVDRIYMDAAVNIKKKTSNPEAEPGLDQTSSFNSTSSSDHESLLREIQLKYGHDKMLAENVYADLMEKKFQEETAAELRNRNKEQIHLDSVSSSDSDYVPNKDR